MSGNVSASKVADTESNLAMVGQSDRYQLEQTKCFEGMPVVSLSYLRFSRHRSFLTHKKNIIYIRQILTLSIMFRIKYNIFLDLFFQS